MGKGSALLAMLAAVTILPLAAFADDYGPAREVGRVRSDAMRLLAHRVRLSGVEPKSITITDVAVVRNAALLSWAANKMHGIMGLSRLDERWWEVWDMESRPAHAPDCMPSELAAAAAASRTVPNGTYVCSTGEAYNRPVHIPVQSAGGIVHFAPSQSAGYDLTMTYAHNDAAGGAAFGLLYARAPTHAEFLPNPVPPRDVGGPTDVGFFDVEITGSKPVTFAAGTTIAVWAPFVLDDTLRYDLSFFSDDKPYGPYHGTIFDNVLHFELPGLTIAPGKTLAAEISGWY